MKKANQIISHLKSQPYLKNLKQLDCYNEMLLLLPKSLSKHVRFIYHKNDTLFFVLEHPSIKMEFNYKRNLIKSILNKFVEFHPECSFMANKEIKAFVTNKPKQNYYNFLTDRKVLYKERSSAKFKNFAEDKELKKLFEAIRETINANVRKKD